MPLSDPALHHHTPDVTVAGSTGQTVRALHFLRRPGDSLNIPARILVTRTLTDLPARTDYLSGPRPLADGTPDARVVTGLIGQTLLSRTADAGDTLVLSDAAGRPLWSRNPQGTVTTLQYEPATLPGRPLRLTEHPAGGLSRVRERFSYGTSVDAPHNLAGALTVHHDNAGLSEVLSVSLTGVPLRAQQRLLPPEAGLPDWGSTTPPVTEAPLQTSTVTDACGAVLSQTNAAGVTALNSYDVTGTVARTRLRWQTGGLSREALILNRVVRDAGRQILSQTAGNGVVETFEYAPQTLRLTRHRVTRPSGHPSGAAVLADLMYGYDPAGNILSLSDAAVETQWHSNREVTGVRTYAYDTLARLTSASGRERITADGAWQPYTQSFTYDDGGNLIKTVHAGQQGWTREMAVSMTSNRAVIVPAGKALGNVNPDEHFLPGGLQKTLADGRALSWSADGQLGGVSPVVRRDGADDTESYHYSDGGTRVRKVRSTAVSGGRQSTVVTYAGGSETRARRTSTGALSLDVAITESGGVRVVQDRINNETHLRYGFTDHLNSVGGETDAAGNVISREEYYAYGGSAGNDEGAAEVTDRTRRYSGKERDATGLYYYGFRYYQPWVGRWLSADPGGLIDGINLFHMCRNNPVRYSDNNGLDSIDNIAHFIWIGGSDISRETTGNIIDFKRKNPDFTVNLWTDNSKKTESDIVSQGLSLSGFKKNVAIRSISTLYENDNEVIGSSLTMPRMSILKSAVSREVNGSYNNLAAASDLLRYAILAQEGGIYLDVDVHTEERMDAYTEMNEGILIYQGDDGGVSNAVMASEADGANINTILNYALSPYDRNGKMPTFQENQESPMTTYFRLYGVRSTNKKDDEYLTRSTQIAGGNATSAMYGAKRFYPQARRHLTLSVTGPRMLVNYLSASEADGTAREDLLFPDPNFFGQRGALNRTTQVHEHNPNLNDGGHWTGLRRDYRGGRRSSV